MQQQLQWAQFNTKQMKHALERNKSTFCLRTPSGGCGNKWCDCGVDAPTKCMKQHTQIYRLKQLRKPVNFKMVLCGQMGAPGRLKPPPADGDIEFKLHPLAAQQVQASLSTLPWEGNAGEGGGIDSDSDDAEPATDGQEGESEQAGVPALFAAARKAPPLPFEPFLPTAPPRPSRRARGSAGWRHTPRALDPCSVRRKSSL